MLFIISRTTAASSALCLFSGGYTSCKIYNTSNEYRSRSRYRTYFVRLQITDTLDQKCDEELRNGSLGLVKVIRHILRKFLSSCNVQSFVARPLKSVAQGILFSFERFILDA